MSSRRGGRAVDRAGLENRKAERPREFESHPLRQNVVVRADGVLKLDSAIRKIVFALSIAVCQSRARAKSVRRLPQELHLTRFPQG